MIKKCFSRVLGKVKLMRYENAIFILYGFTFTIIGIVPRTDIVPETHTMPIAFGVMVDLAIFCTAFTAFWGGALLSLILVAAALLGINSWLLSIILYILTAIWISRDRLFFALSLPLVVEGSRAVFFDDLSGLLTLACGMSIAVPTGLGLRMCSHKFNVSSLDVPNIRAQERHRVIREIKTDLHNTVARDLVQLSLMLQNLPYQNDIEQKSRQMQAHISHSLGSVRDLMNRLETCNLETLFEAADKCRLMLSERRIRLACDLPKRVLMPATEQQITLLHLAISEGCLNILKYGAPHSKASVRVEQVEDGTIALTITNDMDHAGGTTLDSGGYGLANLAQEVRASGGDIYSWRDGDRWILTILVSSPSPIKITRGGPHDSKD